MLTPTQIELARNALGLNYSQKSYRNRFLAAGDNKREWEAMEAGGYAESGKVTNIGTWFDLTLKGAKAVLRSGESLCREDFPNQ